MRKLQPQRKWFRCNQQDFEKQFVCDTLKSLHCKIAGKSIKYECRIDVKLFPLSALLSADVADHLCLELLLFYSYCCQI